MQANDVMPSNLDRRVTKRYIVAAVLASTLCGSFPATASSRFGAFRLRHSVLADSNVRETIDITPARMNKRCRGAMHRSLLFPGAISGIPMIAERVARRRLPSAGLTGGSGAAQCSRRPIRRSRVVTESARAT